MHEKHDVKDFQEYIYNLLSSTYLYYIKSTQYGQVHNNILDNKSLNNIFYM